MILNRISAETHPGGVVLDLVCYGSVDLVNRQLDQEAGVQFFHTLDNALGLVPFLGKAVSHMTKIYLTLKDSSPCVSIKSPTSKIRLPTKAMSLVVYP